MLDVLIISGPLGGGKTSVMLEAHEQLIALDVPHGAVDLDALSWCHPRPSSDPYNAALAFRNLGHLWREFSAQGAQRLLIARVVESRDELALYREVLPDARLQVARLRVPPSLLEARLRAREAGESLDAQLSRAAELSAQLEDDGFADFVVDNGERPLGDVAREVLRRAGRVG